MLFAADTEATWLAGTAKTAPGLALWTAAPTGSPGDGPIDVLGDSATSACTLVLAEGSHECLVRVVALRELLDALILLPGDAEVSASVRAWSVAARLALDLVARGRLVPTIDASGADSWALGPLDPADHERRRQLIEALPAPAHAAEDHAGSGLLTDPGRAVVEFQNAVADALVRTAAAPLVTGSPAFAATERTDVSAVASWLESVASATGGRVQPGLRIELPADPEANVRVVLQIQSQVDPSLVLDAASVWSAPPAVLARFGNDIHSELLLTLRRAAQVWPPIDRLLSVAAPEELALADAEVEDLFGPIADDLSAAGLPVLWPAEVFRPIEMAPVITMTAHDPDEPGRRPGLDVASLGELTWTATIDGLELTAEEIQQLTDAKRPIVRLRGNWVRADLQLLEQATRPMALSTGAVLAAGLTGLVPVHGSPMSVALSRPLQALTDRIVHASGSRELPAPEGLTADLRPYQRRGLAWLAEMAELGVGGVLADDMGLGKTVQVLALHVHRQLHEHRDPLLVVCPASLMTNWQREAQRFCPSIPVRIHHGSQRSLDDLAPDEIVVTTYGVLRRDPGPLTAHRWGLVVADEAQAAKNPASRTAEALRLLPASARFALTGTPVENRLTDLWSLLDWTTPGLLYRLPEFQKEIALPIERDRDPDALELLTTLTRPFVLRRRKSDPDIAPELPPKTETDRFIGLTLEQATLYRAVATEMLEQMRSADRGQRSGIVLALLTALKQICNHPAQYLGQDGPIGGRSAKLDAVTELVETIVDEGESVLVFTQYVAMGRILTEWFAGHGLRTAFLQGATSLPERQRMVDDFQDGEPMAFVVSLRAGGTGLNLTRATHVIHVDRWWNPAVEDQASDRAWRIGQTRPVQIHRMVCEGTLEERIAVLLAAKRTLADAVISTGESWLTDLDDAQLAALVGLDGGSWSW